ncbi:hypothetical protein Esti_002927 [Eimeria stiedai]
MRGQNRRLAGGFNPYDDNAPERPPHRIFRILCADLGEWMPTDPLPGGQRLSPLLFEEILRSLEETDSPAYPPATSAFNVTTEDGNSQASSSSQYLKRLASVVFDEEDDEPGPSWKFPRTHKALPSVQSAHLPLTQPAPSGSAACLPQPQQAPYATAYDRSSSWSLTGTHDLSPSWYPAHAAAAQGLVAPPSVAITPSGLPLPSSTQAGICESSRGSPAQPNIRSHPFVRLPTVLPGVVKRAFLPKKTLLGCTSHGPKLYGAQCNCLDFKGTECGLANGLLVVGQPGDKTARTCLDDSTLAACKSLALQADPRRCLPPPTPT